MARRVAETLGLEDLLEFIRSLCRLPFVSDEACLAESGHDCSPICGPITRARSAGSVRAYLSPPSATRAQLPEHQLVERDWERNESFPDVRSCIALHRTRTMRPRSPSAMRSCTPPSSHFPSAADSSCSFDGAINSATLRSRRSWASRSRESRTSSPAACRRSGSGSAHTTRAESVPPALWGFAGRDCLTV